MKILITGCKGQLGSELTKCFEQAFTELGSPEILKQKNKITAVDIDELDISDLKSVKEFITDEKFDAVINCAAYTNVDGCETNTEAAFRVNAIGSRNLALSCEETGAKIVHISTDYVFAGNGNTPYAEWDKCDPQSVYGKTKYLGEEYVRNFCTRYFIIRTAWLYGYEGKNFVKTMINAGKKFGALTVVNDQRGNPTNVADLAHHILKLLTTEEYGIYHGTGNGECSWYEFAAKIIEFAGVNAAVSSCSTEEYAKKNPQTANRPSYSSLDNMMFRATVGDEFRNWQDALKAFFENYKGD